jgi:drug/metabolite transporter (DMT)-like permease
MNSSAYFKGIVLCLVATLSWGAMFPVMGSALQHIDPFTFTLLRYALAGLVFFLMLLRLEGASALKIPARRAALAWVFGTAGFAGFGFLVFWGQQLAGRDGALTASIIMATQPLLGLLVNWLLRKVVPRKLSIAFILLSFCGIALVISKGDVNALLHAPASFSADGLILLGALCWVTYTVGGAFFPDWSPYKYTTVTTGLGLLSIAAIEIMLLVSGTIVPPSTEALLLVTPHLLYMAFIAGVIGVLSWNIGNRTIGAQNGVLFMDVIPLTAFLISSFQGVIPNHSQIAGACFTGAALICNNLYLRVVNRRK